ncbi:MAG TPA: extracellular solute-binding protein, partial [Isosphaeraceae bacterium]
MKRLRAGAVAVAAIGTLVFPGCPGRPGVAPAPDRPFQGTALEVAVVGDPAALKTVAARRGEWEQTRGGRVALRAGSIDPGDAGQVDVLLFPGDRMGELVDREALAVLAEAVVRPAAPPEGPRGPDRGAPGGPAPDPLGFSDVVPAYRDQVTKYGDDRMALPYGASAAVLAYRRDALESQANRAAAAEAGVRLGPPATWDRLDALA